MIHDEEGEIGEDDEAGIFFLPRELLDLLPDHGKLYGYFRPEQGQRYTLGRV